MIVFFIAIVIGKETMSSDEFYKSYFIVPLYNVSVNENIINEDLNGYKIVTNDFIFQNLDGKLFNSEDLYEDIKKPCAGMLYKRPLARYVLIKELDLFQGYDKEISDRNQSIRDNIAEDFSFLLTAMRLKYTGNIQVNRVYALADKEHCSFNLPLSTELSFIDRVFYIDTKMFWWDEYELSLDMWKNIWEYKNKISESASALWLPISYFMSYYSVVNLTEKIIKLCTVWETTLLNDRKSELQYCLMVRGSSLLKKDLSLIFKTAYDLRSQLLHSGNVTNFSLLRKVISDSTKNDNERLFLFIKEYMEPITREILKKFIKNYLETPKSLEKIAQSLDKSVFQKLAEK